MTAAISARDQAIIARREAAEEAFIARRTPKQYTLPALPDWFGMLNAESFEHVRSFLDFDQKLVVCQVSKKWPPAQLLNLTTAVAARCLY